MSRLSDKLAEHRNDPAVHMGLGDIRLTIADQEELIILMMMDIEDYKRNIIEEIENEFSELRKK